MNILVIHPGNPAVFQALSRGPVGSGKSVVELDLASTELTVAGIDWYLRAAEWIKEDFGPNLIVIEDDCLVRRVSLRTMLPLVYRAASRYSAVVFLLAAHFEDDVKREIAEKAERFFIFSPASDASLTARTVLELSNSGMYGKYRIEDGKPVLESL